MHLSQVLKFLKKNLPAYLLCACVFGVAPLHAATPAATKATTLDETVRQVLRFSPTLKAMQENREVLRHMVQSSKSGWYPRVDVNVSGSALTGTNSNRRSAGVNKEEVGVGGQAGVTLSQTIWDGKSTTNTVLATEHREVSMVNRVLDNALSLALDGIIAHINILVRTRNVELAQENVETHRSILSKQASLSTSGVSTAADVTQAQGRLIRAEATLTDTLNQLEEARIAYRQVTGMDPVALSAAPMPGATFDSLPAMLEKTIATNPTLQAMVSDTKAARSDRDVTDAAFQPVVTAEVGPSYADTDSRLRGRYEWQMSATVRARWNLYRGGGDEAEREAAAARVRMARQNVYASADSLNAQVRTAWVGYNTASKLVTTYNSAVEYNLQTRDAYMEQFSVGLRSLLDVLDSESELFNSSTQLSVAQGNKLINAYKLLALQGILFNELGVDPLALDKRPEEAQGALIR